MANIKASKKSIRKTAKLTLKNKAEKSRLRTFFKKLSTCVEAKDASGSKAAAIIYMSALDKAVKHHVIHANKANRLKSRLTPYIFVGSTDPISSTNEAVTVESEQVTEASSATESNQEATPIKLEAKKPRKSAKKTH